MLRLSSRLETSCSTILSALSCAFGFEWTICWRRSRSSGLSYWKRLRSHLRNRDSREHWRSFFRKLWIQHVLILWWTYSCIIAGRNPVLIFDSCIANLFLALSSASCGSRAAASAVCCPILCSLLLRSLSSPGAAWSECRILTESFHRLRLLKIHQGWHRLELISERPCRAEQAVAGLGATQSHFVAWHLECPQAFESATLLMEVAPLKNYLPSMLIWMPTS